MKENNKKYNAIDFARYHSGEMRPDEMQVLERAALEDPFLADALEGYMYSKDPEKELAELRMQLDEKRKQQKLFTITSLSAGTWWKIAAMFILFAGLGYFFYATNSKKEPSLAVKNDEPKKQNPPSISPANEDTTATEDNIAFEKPTSGKNENSRIKLPLSNIKAIEVSRGRKTLPEQRRTQKRKKSLGQSLEDKKENGITMNSDKAISSDIKLKDSGEQSFFHPSDTTALVAASPAGYNRDSEHAVAMNKRNATLNEVVVTGYGTHRKENITGAVSDKLEGKVSGVNVTTAAPYLKEGKENFDQYIKDNAVPVLDSTGERIASNILLSFTLNKKGKPAHINVLQSSCEACEKEAIRLLENGPRWIGKRGDSATVRIQF
jgi:hypothetical protein